MNKICNFCNKEATHTPLDVMSNYGIDVYFCFPCQAEYVIYDEDVYDSSIYVYIGERLFRWSNIARHGYSILYYIGIPGIPGQLPNKDLHHIKSFKSDIPDITPSNIKEKIKTYLVFM